MKTTNEMIHDLVAREFELPEGLKWQRDINAWVLEGSGTCADCTFEVSDAVAHDLTSATFAWQMAVRGWGRRKMTLSYDHQEFMRKGLSKSAIKTLWDAVCGGGGEGKSPRPACPFEAVAEYDPPTKENTE